MTFVLPSFVILGRRNRFIVETKKSALRQVRCSTDLLLYLFVGGQSVCTRLSLSPPQNTVVGMKHTDNLLSRQYAKTGIFLV